MFIFYAYQESEKSLLLKEEEARHCSKVLRKNIGDEIAYTLGDGFIRNARITNIDRHTVSLSGDQVIEDRHAQYPLAIAMAPTKNISRFEWFLEKSVEIGITEIIPFISDRSERRSLKHDRCEKIIVAAMKQSKNVQQPLLHTLTPLKHVFEMVAYDQKFIAHCMDPQKHLKNCYKPGLKTIILIGPEGDFSEMEIQVAKTSGFEEISLGKSRLRTETAGIFATGIINVMNI